MPYKINPAIFRLFLRISGFLAVALLWEALPRAGIADPTYFPPLSAVLQEVWHLLLTRNLFGNALASLWRVTTGALLAAVVAVPLGTVLGYWLPKLADGLNPLFRILAQVNPFSLMTVFLLFFGVGEEAKLAVVTWVAFWPIIHHSVEGARNADPDLLKSAQSMGISRTAMLFRVLLPVASPAIFLGIRTAILLLFFILVAGEMLGGMAGLGWMLHWASNYYNYPYATLPTFAVGLSISILGAGISLVLRKLENSLLFWKEPVSLWKTSPSAEVPKRKQNRVFVLGAVTATLLILVVGGFETARLNKASNSFSGENDAPPVIDDHGSPPQEVKPKAAPSDHSGHSNHNHISK